MSPKKNLHVGKTPQGKRFTLPPEIASQTTAILGVRGSGKTVTATVLVEELLELGWPVVVVDPVDSWWGLKSRGAEAGYPVVILGDPRNEHTDLPLTADSGAILADFAVDRRIPMVLSLRHLRKNAQRSFVTAFAEQLYHRKGEVEHRTPLLFVIDEASAFVPQRVAGDVARMVGAIEDLVRRGRSVGIGVVLVDQRPASVNKDVLTQLEILVAHRVTSPQDTKALNEWIRLHDSEGHEEEFLEVLSSLPTGEAWFWGPTLDLFERVEVRMRHTVDSSRTPKTGEAPVAAGKLAEVDLEALREQLEDTIAEAEASDPKKLRQRIVQLEKDLRKATTKASGGPSAGDLRALEEENAALRQGLEELEEKTGNWARDAVQPLERRVGVLETTLERGREVAQKLVEVLAVPSANGDQVEIPAPPEIEIPEARKAPSPRAERPAPRRRPAPAPSTPRETPDEMPDAQVRILDALATLESIGVDEVTRTNLALFSSQSPKSSAYGAHVAELAGTGMISYPRQGMVALTDEGRKIGRARFEIASAEDLHDAWLGYLAGAQARILRVLLDLYPADVDRTELAELAGQSPKSSAYGAHVAQLQQLGAVEYPVPGRVKATELLFPPGLR